VTHEPSDLQATRFRGIRNAVLAGAVVTAVLVAIDGWQERGVVGVLLAVLGAVIAVPLVVGVLWLILRPGRGDA
jgi:hypothetical protein